MKNNEDSLKVVLVTGVSSGVGFELFKQFCAMPEICVIGVSRNSERLNELEIACQEIGGNDFQLVQADITHKGSLYKLIELVKSKGKLDVLINNAGAIVNKRFETITEEDLHYCYETNVFAPFLLVQQLLPWLTLSSLAHVVNIGSMGGVQGSAKFLGLSAYSSSKGALITLTECLAEELKDRNIRVNCVNLGAVQTEMLTKAFPGYIANHKPVKVAKWLINFALTSHHLMNGKSIQLSDSTP